MNTKKIPIGEKSVEKKQASGHRQARIGLAARRRRADTPPNSREQAPASATPATH